MPLRDPLALRAVRLSDPRPYGGGFVVSGTAPVHPGGWLSVLAYTYATCEARPQLALKTRLLTQSGCFVIFPAWPGGGPRRCEIGET